jgi:poly(3-hydroxybutyrate) depolymerase
MKFKILLLAVLLSATASASTSGTELPQTLTWDGITRYYNLYIPPGMPPQPMMVLCLHATVPDSTGTNIPTNWCAKTGWNVNADHYGYLLVSPASTWNSAIGKWFWNAYTLDPLFPTPPDDAGFLRDLIQTLMQQYNVNPNQVFVAGASSGGFMAHTVGIESSDLVAAISSQSGMLWADTTTLPNIISPVSVLQCEGQNDNTVPDCGGSQALWGKSKIPYAGIDDTINYWLQQDGLPANTGAPFCTNGQLTPDLYSYDAKGSNGVEVEYVLELGVGHGCDSAFPEAVAVFFLTHPKVPSAAALKSNPAESHINQSMGTRYRLMY